MQDECGGGDDDCYEDDNDDDDDDEGASDNQLDKTLTIYIGNLQRNAKPFSLIQHFDAKKHSGRYKEKANWKNFFLASREKESGGSAGLVRFIRCTERSSRDCVDKKY